jgi:hypothetical protein
VITSETRIPTTMPDPAPTDRTDHDDTARSRSSDDTVELDAGPTLADELLHSDHPAEDEVEQGEQGEQDERDERDERDDLERGERADARPSGGLPSPATDSTGPDEDDDYFEPDGQRRSRVTTGLLVALIFALGVLTGVLVGRLLTPTPAPQVVYVLNDAPSSAPVPSAPVPSAATPSAGR